LSFVIDFTENIYSSHKSFTQKVAEATFYNNDLPLTKKTQPPIHFREDD